MLRAAVLVLALAGLTVLAAGVMDAVPLVYWGSREELASVEHGRTVMFAGAALTLVAAAAVAALRRPRAAALLAFAPVLPVGLAVAAEGTAFGLLALPVALGIGLAGVIALLARRASAA
jgi:hypothetical protein